MFVVIDNVDVTSDADDNTLYKHRKFPNKVLKKLECASRNIFEWSFHNTVKANPGKCHFLPSLDMNTKISAKI